MTDTDSHPPSTQASRDEKKRPKAKPRRKPRRRDGSGSEGGADDVSDGIPSETKVASPADIGKPVFPDVNSTTPAAWADMTDQGEEVTFEEFNRGETGRGRGAAARAHGRGGKALRVLTEDDKKKIEERAVVKRERQKAKRKEVKEAKRKEREAAAGQPARNAVVASEAEADMSLTASTSVLKLDDPEQATAASPAGDQPRLRNNRAAYTQRVAEDPKFIPRVGNFWMHDQRHYESGNVGDSSFSGLRTMSDYWRGRGVPRGLPRGAFRGGPRGRGRGGFVPFNAPVPPPPPAEPLRGARITEMDKLEIELAQTMTRPSRKPLPSSSSSKWGHEGFVEMSTEEPFRPNRALRGRGRGRGFVRGNMRAFPNVPAHLPTPEASPDRSGKAAKATEGNATQPAVESLLHDSGAVTVRLPGDAEGVAVEAHPSTEPTDASVQSPPPPSFSPSHPSPVPHIGSDSGSMSSGYMPAGPVVGPVGEFNPGFVPPVNFRPPGGPNFYPRNFPPQSFTPEPQFQPRGSFSGPGYFQPPGPSFTPPVRPRTGSPLNPYAPQQMGYFVPARPTQKVSIRPPAHDADSTPKSPASDDTHSGHGHGPAVVPGPEGFAQGYYPQQQFNPYAAMGDAQGVYYPPQGYWQQGGYEGNTYGYEGEYQGY